MKKTGFVLFNLLAVNAVFAQTSPLSYDYAEAGYGQGEILNEDFSFIDLGASYSLNESLFVAGSYSDGETDDNYGPGFGEIEVSSYNIGLGFHTPLNQKIDLVMSGSYISSEIEFGRFSDDADGLDLAGGLRFKATDQLELNAFVDYAVIENDDDTGFSASAYYFFMPTLSLGLTYADADEADSIAASVRFHF
jgi:hypothetical protein